MMMISALGYLDSFIACNSGSAAWEQATLIVSVCEDFLMTPVCCTSLLQERVPLAWVNQALFDYKGTFSSGTVTLPCWIVNPEEPLEEVLNPIGMCSV